jgi:hypothetical protein
MTTINDNNDNNDPVLMIAINKLLCDNLIIYE